MRVGKSSCLQLNQWDGIYILLSGIVGTWQAWCLNYGSNGLLLAILWSLWSLPFALASYVHASLLKKAGIVNERPDWKRMLVLWAGMQFSLVIFSLTVLMETQIMSVLYRTADNLPFYGLSLLIGEAAACLAWAVCLLVWSRRPVLRRSGNRLLALFAALFAGVLIAAGLATLIRRSFQKDFYFLLTSVVATMISALILVLLRGKTQEVNNRNIGTV